MQFKKTVALLSLRHVNQNSKSFALSVNNESLAV